jgi:transposase
MPRAYSLDLRERVARFVSAGHSRRAAAAHFAVSVSFVVNLMKAYHAGAGLEPKPSGGRRHAKLDRHRTFLLERLAEKDDITMPELSAELFAATGTKAIVSTSDRHAASGWPHDNRPCGVSRKDWFSSTRPAQRQK